MSFITECTLLKSATSFLIPTGTDIIFICDFFDANLIFLVANNLLLFTASMNASLAFGSVFAIFL